MGVRAPLAAIAVLLMMPAASIAGTVSMEDPCGGQSTKGFSCEPNWHFVAADGEANDLSTSTAPGGGIRLRDSGAPLTAGERCTQVSEHEADCQAAFGVVETGDGDDRVSLRYAYIQLGSGDDRLEGGGEVAEGGPGNDTMVGGSGLVRWSGGPGDDVLQADGDPASLDGGEGNDVLDSGAGNDFLAGGPGNDVLRAGAGDDLLSEGYFAPRGDEPDDDTYDGGEGRDTVSYVRSTGPVTVDLADPGPDGAAGESDRLVGIENVGGTRGDDTLIGDAGANLLAGGPGHDVLRGGGGADDLQGGEGFDRFDGGGGNDLLDSGGDSFYYYLDPSAPSPSHFVTDSTDEPMDCGDGMDTVLTYLDDVQPTCERAKFVAFTRSATFALQPAAATGETLAFRVPCPKPLRRAKHRTRCGGRLTLQGYETDVSRHFSVPAAGGAVTLNRPPKPTDGGADRVLIKLRYDARPPFLGNPSGPYGVQTYLTLPSG